MGTLMESSARPCEECNGEKTIALRPESCNHAGCACPCGWKEVDCPRCDGSGVEGCTSCGEPSTIRYLGEDWCEDCAPAEDMRFSACSICERPIDVREQRTPLCTSCESSARAHGRLMADAQRYPDPDHPERAA